MNNNKYPKISLLLVLFLFVTILLFLTQTDFLEKTVIKPSKNIKQQIHLPSPTRTVIIDPASAWGL